MSCRGCAARRAAIIAATSAAIATADAGMTAVTSRLGDLPTEVAAMAARFTRLRRGR